MQLHERTWLLIGATGGIGRAIKEQMRSDGARLITTSRDPGKAQEIGEICVQLDLAGDNLRDQLADILHRFPEISGVIHCAGQNRFASIEAYEPAAVDGMLDVNLRSAVILSQVMVPHLRLKLESALVFVGSTFGSIGYPGYSVYCAAKFGLRGFTEALRRELADTSVRVMYVAPRATQTAMNPEAVNHLNKALGNAMDDPAKVAGQVVAAIRENRARTFMGWPERFFVFLNGLLPKIVDRALGQQLPTIRKYLKGEIAP